VWRVRRPFGRGIRLHRASRSSRRDGGDAPGRRFPRVRARAVPSACLPFVPRRAGTIERGSLFACRVATASVTPFRERYGGLRRPGGPQSNRQFLPVVLTYRYAVRGGNSSGRDVVTGFIPAVNGGAFSSYFRNHLDSTVVRRTAERCDSTVVRRTAERCDSTVVRRTAERCDYRPKPRAVDSWFRSSTFFGLDASNSR